MPNSVIDLRSDTVTKPTAAMREAILAAEVGDDVFSEDPGINELQEKVAAMFGKEAALFVPSGTMSNQICIRAQTQPGDEIICEYRSHIYNFEAGGPAVLSGVMCHTVEGDGGILDLSQIESRVRPDNEHLARTRMVCLENTHNWGGGRIYPLEKIQAISEWARSQSLIMHLDGARLWNAIIATGIDAPTWASHFDSVSVCFSKGLGAPIGSALIGSREMVARSRRIRKLFGGGMRQGGIAASAALYALEHHLERLSEDHENAQILARAVEKIDGLSLDPPEVDTNIVWIAVDPELATGKEMVQALEKEGVRLISIGPQSLRACTHLDVSREQVEHAAQVLRDVATRVMSA